MRESQNIVASTLDSEYRAMKEWGISELQWFALPRDERARKVGYIIAHSIVEAMASHDAREDAKLKAAKGKKR